MPWRSGRGRGRRHVRSVWIFAQIVPRDGPPIALIGVGQTRRYCGPLRWQIDMNDVVLRRVRRTGRFFTVTVLVNILQNARHALTTRPVDEAARSTGLCHYSRAYLHNVSGSRK